MDYPILAACGKTGRRYRGPSAWLPGVRVFGQAGQARDNTRGSDQLGGGIPVAMKPRLLDWLAEKGVVMLTGAECREITEEGIIVRTRDGTVRTVIADTVITALPTLSNPALSKALEGVVPEVYAVGDCGESRLILQAIADGSRVGHGI